MIRLHVAIIGVWRRFSTQDNWRNWLTPVYRDYPPEPHGRAATACTNVGITPFWVSCA